jgi:rhodanese-related sulfurtransferase
VEETRLILIPSNLFKTNMRKNSDMMASVGKRVSLCFHKEGSTLEYDADRQLTTPRLTWIEYLLIVGLSVVCALIFNRSNFKGIPIVPKSLIDESVSFESPSVAFDKYKKGETLFVDAMPYSFYEQEHIAGAVSLPMEIFVFMYDMSIGQTDKSKEIIVYGRTISKRYDEEVASNLVARGHKNVKILKGGLDTWRKKHYPVET